MPKKKTPVTVEIEVYEQVERSVPKGGEEKGKRTISYHSKPYTFRITRGKNVYESGKHFSNEDAALRCARRMLKGRASDRVKDDIAKALK